MACPNGTTGTRPTEGAKYRGREDLHQKDVVTKKAREAKLIVPDCIEVLRDSFKSNGTLTSRSGSRIIETGGQRLRRPCPGMGL
ncbi:hypothetical protein EVAR_27985_1 [Eumeta japonica]|uniref:Uncharacterized protein n=1 Tax=Eumeta variegata TaxID=151549 RepID=A0A4C1WDT3_EUMVA|nr:hypothetical protein EVAR_27985_1 [Eumeta japonica]